MLIAKKHKDSNLVTHWQQKMSEYNKAEVVPLSPKELGQMKLLFRKTGGISKRLINLAFDNWDMLTHEVASAKAISEFPEHPRIGYLLAHRDVAISLLVKLGKVEEEDVLVALEMVKYIDEWQVFF